MRMEELPSNCLLENTGIARKPAWSGHTQKKKPFTRKGSDCLAEKEGFEPSIQVLPGCALSRGVPSTTRPPLRRPRILM